jgi:predicted ATP-grasp superfamily ATP-dependent carboligase
MRVLVYEHVSAGGLGPEAAASLRREGEAMLAAVVADFRQLPGIDVEKVSGPFYKKGPDTFYLVIAPEFDDHLCRLSQTVLDVGGQLLGSLPEAIRLTGDKLELAHFWRKRRVPQPHTQLHDFGSFAFLDGPWIYKPRHGAGSRAILFVRDQHEELVDWSEAIRECPDDDFILQPCVPGQAASVSLLMSATQTIPLLPAAQHLSEDGQFRYLGGSLPLPEPLASRAVKIALQAVAGIDGLQGYVGVDLVLGDHGNDYAIEINPRLTTSYLGLRQLCEQNLAHLMLRLAQGETIMAPTWKAGEVRFEPDVDL